MRDTSVTVSQTAAGSRHNNFNLLRLFFASLVILSHSSILVDGNRHRELLYQAFHTISFGALAVDGFFVLSGYLIVQSWQAVPKTRVFLAKRCLRIYPGFIIAALACVLIVGPLGQGASVAAYFAEFQFWPFLKSVLTMDSPVTPPVFPGQPHPIVNGSMWTITYEFRCYLLVLLFGVFGLLKRRFLWLTMSITSLVLFAFFPELIKGRSFYGLHIFLHDSEQFVRFFTFFSMGGCFYLFRERIKYHTGVAAIAILVLLPCLYKLTMAKLALATLGSYLLFWIAFTRVNILERFWKLSDISYGVYLYGWPVQKVWLWYFPAMSPWVLFPLALAGSCCLGWLSWHLVEAPFLRLKTRLKPPVVVCQPGQA